MDEFLAHLAGAAAYRDRGIIRPGLQLPISRRRTAKATPSQPTAATRLLSARASCHPGSP